ncbi:MAG: hypothetical protein ACXVLZ_11615 [Acidimicrobiia bacterium]
MRVDLVGDLGPEVGLGHRRRLEAVATALGARSIAATVGDVGAVPLGAAVLVVDSYRYRADDRARFGAGHVVAIDELERDLAVDLVVDPTPGAAPPAAPAARRVLAGAEYALVDPGLAAAATPPADAVGAVLVTFGASPAATRAPEVAATIAAAHADVAVTVALGPWVVAEAPAPVRVVRPTDGLRAELLAADLVVTAGGVTLLEACAAARASVAVELAENQHRAIAGLVAAGATVAATLDSVPAAVDGLIGDADARHRIAACARATIDGRGAARVAAAIAELVAP